MKPAPINSRVPLTARFGNAVERKSIRQIILYGIVGGLINLIAYLCFLLITMIGVEPKLAMTLIYLVFATLGFWGHKHWTFSHKGADRESAIKYVLAHISAYLINLAFLYLFFNILGISYKLVQAGAMLFVAGYLFLLFKFVVFPEARN